MRCYDIWVSLTALIDDIIISNSCSINFRFCDNTVMDNISNMCSRVTSSAAYSYKYTQLYGHFKVIRFCLKSYGDYVFTAAASTFRSAPSSGIVQLFSKVVEF